MKKLKWTVIIIIALIGISALVLYGYLRSTLPDYTGEISVKEIKEEVEIIRDSYGVPHIYAQSNEDAYFALGYCMAQDRLFQMEMLRIASQGRLSEIFGESMLKADKLFRTFFAPCNKQKVLAEMHPEARSVLEAFIAGINRYLGEENPLPFEFLLLGHTPEVWKAEDIASITLFISRRFSSAFNYELLYAAFIEAVGREMADIVFPPNRERYLVDFSGGRSSTYRSLAAADPRRQPPAHFPIEADLPALLGAIDEADKMLPGFGLRGAIEACNNFGIGSEKSETGKPLLMHDCHIPRCVPSMFYEAHLITPAINISGQLSIAYPAFWAGHAEKGESYFGWTYTAAFVDELDFYIEKINPDNPDQYLFKGRWEDMKKKKELITVKGGTAVEHTVRMTRHGPIIDDIIADPLKKAKPAGTVLAMRWAGNDLTKQYEAAHLATVRVKGVRDFIAEIGHWNCPAAHIIVADNKGDLAYILVAGIPLRKNFDGSLPVPGWEGKYEWQGYVPWDGKPVILNPKPGFVNTSNTRQPIPRSYPYELGNVCSDPDRALRVSEIIKEILDTKGKFGMDDMNRVYSDILVIRAREYLPLLLDALKGIELSDTEKAARNALAQWDFLSRKEEIAPQIYQVLFVHLIENTYSPHLPRELYAEYLKINSSVIKGFQNIMLDRNSPWFDNPKTGERENRADMLRKSFRDAVSSLEENMGDDPEDWVLGEHFTLTLEHPFSRKVPLLGLFADIGPYPMDGGFTVPYATTPIFSKPYTPHTISHARHIIDSADRRNAKVISLPGISGNFMSPHYDDQFGLWYRFEYRTLMLYRDQVEAERRYTMTMKPE